MSRSPGVTTTDGGPRRGPALDRAPLSGRFAVNRVKWLGGLRQTRRTLSFSADSVVIMEGGAVREAHPYLTVKELAPTNDDGRTFRLKTAKSSKEYTTDYLSPMLSMFHERREAEAIRQDAEALPKTFNVRKLSSTRGPPASPERLELRLRVRAATLERVDASGRALSSRRLLSIVKVQRIASAHGAGASPPGGAGTTGAAASSSGGIVVFFNDNAVHRYWCPEAAVTEELVDAIRANCAALAMRLHCENVDEDYEFRALFSSRVLKPRIVFLMPVLKLSKYRAEPQPRMLVLSSSTVVEMDASGERAYSTFNATDIRRLVWSDGGDDRRAPFALQFEHGRIKRYFAVPVRLTRRDPSGPTVYARDTRGVGDSFPGRRDGSPSSPAPSVSTSGALDDVDEDDESGSTSGVTARGGAGGAGSDHSPRGEPVKMSGSVEGVRTRSGRAMSGRYGHRVSMKAASAHSRRRSDVVRDLRLDASDGRGPLVYEEAIRSAHALTAGMAREVLLSNISCLANEKRTGPVEILPAVEDHGWRVNGGTGDVDSDTLDEMIRAVSLVTPDTPSESIMAVLCEFNANAPVAGLAQTHKHKAVTALFKLLLSIKESGQAIRVDLLLVICGALRRLLWAKIGFNEVTGSLKKQISSVLEWLVRSEVQWVSYAGLLVMQACVDQSTDFPDGDFKHEIANRRCIIEASSQRDPGYSLVTLLGQRLWQAPRGTTNIAVQPDTIEEPLFTDALLELLESLIKSRRKSTPPSALSLLMSLTVRDLSSSRGSARGAGGGHNGDQPMRVLVGHCRSPCTAIASNARRLLRAQLSKGHAAVGNALQELARRDGLLLWDLIVTVSHPKRHPKVLDTRELLRYLVTNNGASIDVVRRAFPPELFEDGLDLLAYDEYGRVVSRGTSLDSGFLLPRRADGSWDVAGDVAMLRRHGGRHDSSAHGVRLPTSFFDRVAADAPDVTSPELVWTATTRAEVLRCLVQHLDDIEGTRAAATMAAVAASHGSVGGVSVQLQARHVAWNPADLSVEMISLRDEVRVGPYYLRLLFDNGDDAGRPRADSNNFQEDPHHLVKPIAVESTNQFLNLLYLRLAADPSPEVQLGCARTMLAVLCQSYDHVVSLPCLGELVRMVYRSNLEQSRAASVLGEEDAASDARFGALGAGDGGCFPPSDSLSALPTPLSLSTQAELIDVFARLLLVPANTTRFCQAGGLQMLLGLMLRMMPEVRSQVAAGAGWPATEADAAHGDAKDDAEDSGKGTDSDSGKDTDSDVSQASSEPWPFTHVPVDAQQITVSCTRLLYQLASSSNTLAERLDATADGARAVVVPPPALRGRLAAGDVVRRVVQLLQVGSTTLTSYAIPLLSYALSTGPPRVDLWRAGLFHSLLQSHDRVDWRGVADLLSSVHMVQPQRWEMSRLVKRELEHGGAISDAEAAKRIETLSSSALLPLLPVNMISLLVRDGPAAFAAAFEGGVRSPRAVWTRAMRVSAADRLREFLVRCTDDHGAFVWPSGIGEDGRGGIVLTYPELNEEEQCDGVFLWPFVEEKNSYAFVLDDPSAFLDGVVLRLKQWCSSSKTAGAAGLHGVSTAYVLVRTMSIMFERIDPERHVDRRNPSAVSFSGFDTVIDAADKLVSACEGASDVRSAPQVPAIALVAHLLDVSSGLNSANTDALASPGNLRVMIRILSLLNSLPHKVAAREEDPCALVPAIHDGDYTLGSSHSAAIAALLRCVSRLAGVPRGVDALVEVCGDASPETAAFLPTVLHYMLSSSQPHIGDSADGDSNTQLPAIEAAQALCEAHEATFAACSRAGVLWYLMSVAVSDKSDSTLPPTRAVAAVRSLVRLTELPEAVRDAESLPERYAQKVQTNRALHSLLTEGVAADFMGTRVPDGRLLSVLSTDSRSPHVLWTAATRNELRLRVHARVTAYEKQSFGARIAGAVQKPTIEDGEAASISLAELEHQGEEEKGFKYAALSRELCVGGMYLRVYNAQPDFSIDEPNDFARELCDVLKRLAYFLTRETTATGRADNADQASTCLESLRHVAERNPGVLTAIAGGTALSSLEALAALDVSGWPASQLSPEVLRVPVAALTVIRMAANNGSCVPKLRERVVASNLVDMVATACQTISKGNAALLEMEIQRLSLGISTLTALFGRSKAPCVGLIDSGGVPALLVVLLSDRDALAGGDEGDGAGDGRGAGAVRTAAMRLLQLCVAGDPSESALALFLPPVLHRTLDSEGVATALRFFDEDHVRPDFVWTQTSRDQLENMVSREWAAWKEERATDPTATWTNLTLPAGGIVYDVPGDVAAANVWIHVLLDQPGFVDSLRLEQMVELVDGLLLLADEGGEHVHVAIAALLVCASASLGRPPSERKRLAENFSTGVSTLLAHAYKAGLASNGAKMEDTANEALHALALLSCVEVVAARLAASLDAARAAGAILRELSPLQHRLWIVLLTNAFAVEAGDSRGFGHQAVSGGLLEALLGLVSGKSARAGVVGDAARCLATAFASPQVATAVRDDARWQAVSGRVSPVALGTQLGHIRRWSANPIAADQGGELPPGPDEDAGDADGGEAAVDVSPEPARADSTDDPAGNAIAAAVGVAAAEASDAASRENGATESPPPARGGGGGGAAATPVSDAPSGSPSPARADSEAGSAAASGAPEHAQAKVSAPEPAAESSPSDIAASTAGSPSPGAPAGADDAIATATAIAATSAAVGASVADMEATASTPTIGSDERFAKYFRLLKMGQPKEQVALKFEAETGYSATLLDDPDAVVSSLPKVPATEPALAATSARRSPARLPPPPASPSRGEESKMVARTSGAARIADDARFAKYFKLLALKMPIEHVRAKFEAETGMDGALLGDPDAAPPALDSAADGVDASGGAAGGAGGSGGGTQAGVVRNGTASNGKAARPSLSLAEGISAVQLRPASDRQLPPPSPASQPKSPADAMRDQLEAAMAARFAHRRMASVQREDSETWDPDDE